MADEQEREKSASLSATEIKRYGRQMILPEWGVGGQMKIKASAVLIVGAGGLGCPAAQYLAAAGVGCIGVVDYDVVEVGNLHRQVLHTEARVGVQKVESLKESITNLNSCIKVTCHHVLLSSANTMDILRQYDVVVDATDNVVTRYLLNDACVLLGKPLVSGSALRFEGQLTVYNYVGGPCYRCLFPTPPPPGTVTNCSEGGVMGAVPGVIGNLQALEVLKIVSGVGDSFSGRLLMFDGLGGTFRVIKLRSRDTACAVCGDAPTITELIDYEMFCGSSPNDKDGGICLLSEDDRVSCQVYNKVLESGLSHVLLDVRAPVEFDICHLHHSHNVCLNDLQQSENSIDRVTSLLRSKCTSENARLYVVCRRGNDSQVAVQLLRQRLSHTMPSLLIHDIIGGLECWSDTIDTTFPKY